MCAAIPNIYTGSAVPGSYSPYLSYGFWFGATKNNFIWNKRIWFYNTIKAIQLTLQLVQSVTRECRKWYEHSLKLEWSSGEWLGRSYIIFVKYAAWDNSDSSHGCCVWVPMSAIYTIYNLHSYHKWRIHPMVNLLPKKRPHALCYWHLLR